MCEEWAALESGTKTGWLFNYYPTTVLDQESMAERSGESSGGRAALTLLFQDHEREVFHVNLFYNPYFFVSAVEGHEHEVELGLISLFGVQLIYQIETVEKEDLDLVNHLSGRKRLYLKIFFKNVQDLMAVRGRLEKIVKRNASMSAANPLLNSFDQSLGDLMAKSFEEDPMNVNASSERWLDWVHEIREYDVKYHMRVAIDLGAFIGVWYNVSVHEGEAHLTRCDDSAYAPAMPRVCAFDIETTKAPLKFPQPEVDQIYMISYMLDGRGYLIVNREFVAMDIHPFEYTPKPEYEGSFDTFNEVDEKSLLRRFYDEMRKYKPNVYVTYNGDYFDFPFIHARSTFHQLSMRDEIGFSPSVDGAFLNPRVPHLDCFYWVKRDSYLPQGSQGLKAVTRYKLGYDPIEVDPEDMLPLAQTNPQHMASYSVSDALSTWYLYQKYVHPFIYSLSTIIPMSPDDVLRKGSGGLCESLLMVQAYANNVIFPNKKIQQLERFFNGHLIDSETYIGGRVEALRSGVYRSDIPLNFNMSQDMYQNLIDDLDNALRFTLEVENNVAVNEVTNYEEVREVIKSKLEFLRDHPRQLALPIIYHLDVGAMYPNIILTNRLQPYAIPKPDVCAGCCFNSPDNEHRCKRAMTWKWKGEFFTAGRHEYQRIKAQLENESFAAAAIQKADLSAVQKKTYGNRKGNVLEGTAFERKQRTFFGRGTGSNRSAAGNGYRVESNHQRKEAQDSLLSRELGGKHGGDDDSNSGGHDDDDGRNDELKAYHKLQETTQFNMLKKRLSEYSRKAYGKIHESREILRSDVVCQRENSFYVDTVRLFRDRRYEYKAALKSWKKKLDAAKDVDEIKLCKSRCVQMESLQLAHKCILNSFYGYVMRKGSRWYSMEMAGIVTYVGATLIQMARTLVQQIGVTLELDTDGIWCCLPNSFPENFTFTTSNPSKAKVAISYPCVVLNKMVHDDYSNHQYQTYVEPGVYERHSECSIYFEVDGPYLAMLLPASREEGKSIKKRYAVFNPDGGLAELKGFELKRRGELMLIKDFQSQVFRRFLDGNSLLESYASAAVVANAALDMLYSRGDGYEAEEILEKLSESSNMTRRLSEYPDSQKSLALTTARRIAEFLGPQMVKDKGLACQFVISRLPAGRPVTERPIPLTIFRADPALRSHFLRKWTGDYSLPVNIDLRQLLDWDYYIARFNGCVQKIITIPAALQQVPNPVPRVPHPEWLHRRVQQQCSRYRQVSLTGMFSKTRTNEAGIPDVEELVANGDEKVIPSRQIGEVTNVNGGDEEDGSESPDDGGDVSDGDADRLRREEEEREEEKVNALKSKYFSPKSTCPLDSVFFSCPGVETWLRGQRQSWTHRAKLRREMVVETEESLTADGSIISSHFIDVKSKALSSMWHIMEVRSDGEKDSSVVVIAVLEKVLYTFRCVVPRRVILDANPDFQIPGAKALGNNRVLPRGCNATNLLLVDIPSGLEGEKMLNELMYTREDVYAVYEAHITRTETLIEKVGCCVNVKAEEHLQKVRKRPSTRGVFDIEDLESAGSVSYLQNCTDRFLFIFHVASDTRGLIGVVNHHTNKGVVVVIQPASAPVPALNWGALIEEAAKSLCTTTKPFEVKMEVSTAVTSAWKIIYNVANEMMESGKTPLFAVLHSSVPTQQLLEQRCLLSSLPYLRVLGAAEDERLLGDPFRWTRLLARRLVHRYCASLLWVEERIAFSRFSGIPLCNLAQDTCAHSWDVLFSRSLHSRSHVLWNARDVCVAFEAVEERPRQVVAPGGYFSWCVEFSLARLDVVAVLFSQMIQEGDDPNAHVLCDRGVTSHFNILRDLVSDLLGQAAGAANSIADALLASFARWIRDSASSCYEPRLLELVSKFAHRALTTVLIRLSKLGGRTVKVDGDSIIVLTPKHTIQDAISFARFMVDSLQDQPMLLLLSFQPVRYWCPFVVLDKRDFASLHLSIENAMHLKENEHVSIERMGAEHAITIWGKLPKKVQIIFLKRLEGTLCQIAEARESVLRDVQADPTVVLATRSEQVLMRVVKAFKSLVEEKLHADLIEEVHMIMECKDLYEEGEVPNGDSFLSSSAVALEYTKSICRFFELFPNDGTVGKMRNNCLRLCGVSPFSPLAQVLPDIDAECRLLMVRCGFCNLDVFLDLGKPEKLLRCDKCHAPISTAAVESHLVRRVNTLVMNQMQQDFVCSKCREVSSSFMSQSCCGPMVGKGKPITSQLRAMKKIAVIQDFSWMSECIDAALRYS